MSEIFSIQRFGKLLQLLLRTHIIPLSITVVLYFVAFGSLHLLVSNIASEPGLAAFLHAVVMIGALSTFPLVCAIMTSGCFKAYHKRSQASAMLLLPCSRVEQFAAPFLLYVILIPMVLGMGALFMERTIMLHSFEALNTMAAASGMPQQENPFVTSMADLIKGITESSAWLSILSSQSVFFAGAIWFKSKQLRKTVALWIGGVIAISVLSSIFDVYTAEMLNSIDFSKEALKGNHTFNTLSNLGIVAVMTGLAWFKFYRHNLP